MCIYSKLIRNKKYTPNGKNGGIIPAVNDVRVLHVPTGCGDCIECRQQKARNWQVRLLEDIKTNTNGKMITLTFSNESIWKITNQLKNKQAKGYQLDNAIATRSIELFRERWRKRFKKSIRHWLVTELGHEGTENIHMHGILWTHGNFQTIRDIWQYGFIWPRPEEERNNYVGEDTINYSVKYVTKIDHDHKYYKSIILTSPGIGANYIQGQDYINNTFNENKTIETYKTRTGHKIAMPTYWRNKIWTEEEREALWRHRLDKEERWICGEKVHASDTKGYWSLIKWHRKRNAELGYGGGQRDTEREEYEQERRKIMQETRIIKIKQNENKKNDKNNRTK